MLKIAAQSPDSSVATGGPAVASGPTAVARKPSPRGLLLAVAVTAAVTGLGCPEERPSPPPGDGGTNEVAPVPDARSDDGLPLCPGKTPDGGASEDEPPAACAPPVVQMFDEIESPHVSSIEGMVFNSDPPSSGPHCPGWGKYQEFPAAAPLPRCNWIHNTEHGAVVLLYNCPGGCPALVERLRKLMATPPLDPECRRARVVLTADPALKTRIAAVAWRRVWTASCLDDQAEAGLREFMAANLGTKGLAPEPDVCLDGQVGPSCAP